MDAPDLQGLRLPGGRFPPRPCELEGQTLRLLETKLQPRRDLPSSPSRRFHRVPPASAFKSLLVEPPGQQSRDGTGLNREAPPPECVSITTAVASVVAAPAGEPVTRGCGRLRSF